MHFKRHLYSLMVASMTLWSACTNKSSSELEDDCLILHQKISPAQKNTDLFVVVIWKPMAMNVRPVHLAYPLGQRVLVPTN